MTSKKFLDCLFLLSIPVIGGLGAAGERGVKEWQNSVHVVIECPLGGISGEFEVLKL